MTVVAQVAKADKRTYGGGRGVRLEVVVTDGSGSLTLVFFSKAAHAHAHRLIPGRRGMFAGKVSVFNRTRQLAHPDYQLLDADEGAEAVDAFARPAASRSTRPASRSPPGRSPRPSTPCSTRSPTGWQDVGDPLPAALRADRGLAPLPEALQKIHRPAPRRTSPPPATA